MPNPNFCTPANRIGSYAPSPSSATDTLFAKNIDCVTLDADLVAAGNLTVAGVDLSTYPDLVAKTQNMTSSPTGTSFTGPLTTSSLNVTQIAANDPTLGVQMGSVINQEVASTTGGNLYNMTNPSLATGGSNTMGLLMGTSKSSTSNAWQMVYVNTAAGSQSNRLDFRMLGYNNPTLALTNGKVGINTAAATEALDVNGNAKINGTLAVTGLFTPTLPIVTITPTIISAASGATTLTHTPSPSIPTTAKVINIHLNGVGLSGYGKIRLQVGSSSSSHLTAANDYNAIATSVQTTSSEVDSDFASISLMTRNFQNLEKLYGIVTLTKLFLTATTWTWYVSGNLFQNVAPGRNGTSVYGYVSNASTNYNITSFRYINTAGANFNGGVIAYSYEN